MPTDFTFRFLSLGIVINPGVRNTMARTWFRRTTYQGHYDPPVPNPNFGPFLKYTPIFPSTVLLIDIST